MSLPDSKILDDLVYEQAIDVNENGGTFPFQIFSAAVLACATAAPYGTFIAYSPVPLVSIPPGDVQAAAIDAKVQAEDYLRAAGDKARELAEQAVENQNEGVIEANDLAKERAEEGFWASEEKRWQALDALKTAEAQADAAIASSSSAVAKGAYVVPGAIVSPATVLAPASVAGAVVAEAKSAAPSEEMKEETKKAEGEATAAVKAAEVENKPAVNVEKPMEAADKESVQVESATAVKSAEAKKEEVSGVVALSQIHPAPVFSNLAAQPWVNAAIAPGSYIPGLKSFVTPILPNYNGQLINPVYLRTAW